MTLGHTGKCHGDDGSRDESDALISQGMPSISGNTRG